MKIKIIILVIISQLCLAINAELFSSIEQMSSLVNIQEEVTKQFKELLRLQNEKIENAKKYLKF